MTKINSNIVLIGDFQFGKSTTFNAICDGRELSPQGVGLKTSGCPITACNLEDNEEKEYAELFWRSQNELERFIMGIYQKEKNGIEEEYVIRQICFLITKFNDSNELSSWRRRKRIDIDDARKIVAYPANWSLILQCDGQIKNVELSDVLFLFLERVVFHIKSHTLATLGCSITDTPGFGAGLWDETTAKEAMLHADALVFIQGGNHTISPLSLDYLEWYSKIGDMKKVIYAFNTRTSRDLAKDLQQVNIAIIKQHGWPVYVSRMVVFNAMLGYYAQKNTAQVSHDCSNQYSEFSPDTRKRILPILAEYLNIDILDANDCKQLMRLVSDSSKLLVESGFEKVLEQISAIVASVCQNDIGLNIEHNSKVLVGNDGQLSLAPGYCWNNDSSFATRIIEGVKWNPNLRHTLYEHIVSTTKEGEWQPIVGYVWDDTATDEKRLKNIKNTRWLSGRPHRDLPHVIADSTVDSWIPEKGYYWRDDSSLKARMKWGVKWTPGAEYGEGKHLITGKIEGEWQSMSSRSEEEILDCFASIINDRLYKYSNIPLNKLINARNSMRVKNSEHIIILYDDTIFGGSREGFLVATGGIYAKELCKDPVFFAWEDIHSISFKASKLIINSTEISNPTVSDNQFTKKLSKAFSKLIL